MLERSPDSPVSNDDVSVPLRRNTHYAWVVTVMLTLAYMCSYIDRQIINLMVDPIKLDLHLTDTKMSLLQGAAFIFSYLIFTPILGRWVDTSNRKNLAAMAVITWCLSSALGGFASNLTMLFISRAGVGAAEAALAPAAFSLISDYFTRDRLPRALGVFAIGPYLGGGFALIVGGLVIGSAATLAESFPLLSGFRPWQLTFILIGMGGVPLGLALFALREPTRQVIGRAVSDDRRFSLADTLGFIWKRRGFYLRFFAAMAFTVVVFYSFPAWIPSILIRGGYGMDARSVGITYGLLVLVMGTLGVLVGPQLEAALRKRGRQSAVIDCITISAAGLVPVCALLLVVHSYTGTLVVAGLAVFLYSMPQPIAASALQIVTPNRMRGIASAIYVIMVSGIGLGLAPTVVALASDYVFGSRIRTSLGVVCTISAAIAAWLARGTMLPFAKAIKDEEAEEAALQLEESPRAFPAPTSTQ
jgi:MFS transporter, Spinster family, sphingosine-1-phosphate transporter